MCYPSGQVVAVAKDAPPHIQHAFHCPKHGTGSTGIGWLVSGMGIPQSPEALRSLDDSFGGWRVGMVVDVDGGRAKCFACTEWFVVLGAETLSLSSRVEKMWWRGTEKGRLPM